jgi:ABC-type dipeptide/oligopeptide/nickel transport system ATPase component
LALLEIDNLQVGFDTEGGLLRAVDGVSFSIEEGKTLGLVGESGSSPIRRGESSEARSVSAAPIFCKCRAESFPRSGARRSP